VKTSPSTLVVPANGEVLIFVETVHTHEPCSYVELANLFFSKKQATDGPTPHGRSPSPGGRDVGAGHDGMASDWQFNDEEQSPPKRARRRATDMHCAEFLKIRQQTRLDADQREIDWLEQRAAEQRGYAEFIESKGKTLQNPDVVASWKFAAAFASKYAGKLVIGPPFVSLVSVSLTHVN
jgi:hypothetical protein